MMPLWYLPTTNRTRCGMDDEMRQNCQAAIAAFEQLSSIKGDRDDARAVRCMDDCESGCYDRAKCTGDISNAVALGGGVAGGLTA